MNWAERQQKIVFEHEGFQIVARRWKDKYVLPLDELCDLLGADYRTEWHRLQGDWDRLQHLHRLRLPGDAGEREYLDAAEFWWFVRSAKGFTTLDALLKAAKG